MAVNVLERGLQSILFINTMPCILNLWKMLNVIDRIDRELLISVRW